jgi:hypothetical protein
MVQCDDRALSWVLEGGGRERVAERVSRCTDGSLFRASELAVGCYGEECPLVRSVSQTLRDILSLLDVSSGIIKVRAIRIGIEIRHPKEGGRDHL